MQFTHPSVQEAAKRLEQLQASYAQQVRAMDAQYLKPVIGTGDRKAIAEVNAVRRAAADVSGVVAFDPAQPLAQPAAAETPKKKRK